MIKLDRGPGYFRYPVPPPIADYNCYVQRKVFWSLFAGLGLIADFTLPLWLGVVATIPIMILSWWIAYRSEWFS